MCSHLRVIPSIWCLLQKPIRHADNKESFLPGAGNLWLPFSALITHAVCPTLTGPAEEQQPCYPSHTSLHAELRASPQPHFKCPIGGTI